jgi:hypothetical protein
MDTRSNHSPSRPHTPPLLRVAFNSYVVEDRLVEVELMRRMQLSKRVCVLGPPKGGHGMTQTRGVPELAPLGIGRREWGRRDRFEESCGKGGEMTWLESPLDMIMGGCLEMRGSAVQDTQFVCHRVRV